MSENITRVAMPVVGGRLSAHFGHCEVFTMFDVDTSTGQIQGRQDLPSPPHQPGLLPPWLAEQGANVVIAGGIGGRARTLLEEQGVKLVPGAPNASPEEVVQAWLDGKLTTADVPCSESDGGCS